MNSDSIYQGEAYDLSLSAQDAAGDPIVIDGTWSAAFRIVEKEIGGTELLADTMAIADGVATYSCDTSAWSPGRYVYDMRLTNPDGDDLWTEPVALVVKKRITEGS